MRWKSWPTSVALRSRSQRRFSFILSHRYQTLPIIETYYTTICNFIGFSRNFEHCAAFPRTPVVQWYSTRTSREPITRHGPNIFRSFDISTEKDELAYRYIAFRRTTRIENLFARARNRAEGTYSQFASSVTNDTAYASLSRRPKVFYTVEA